MDSIRKRKKTRGLALILAGALCFSNHFTFVSTAKNSDQTKKKMENDLSKLKKNKAAITNELSAATASLQSTVKEIEATQKELGISKARAIGHYELMKKRIKYIYESSSGDFMSMLLEAESMADLLNKADFISSVNEYDRSMLEKLRQIQADIAKKEKLLLKQQKNLNSQKKTLSKKYSQLTSMITDKSNDLAAYEKKLAEAKAAAEAAERLQREKEEAQKRAEEEKKQQEQNKKPPSNEENNNNNSKPDNKPDNKPGKPNKPSRPAAVEDVALFAGILECEAGSSNRAGLLAVATVIMNRLESPSFPNTLSGVIYQSGQFSPTWTGKLDKVLARGPKPLCYSVAKSALAGARHEKVLNCYSFRASFTGVPGITIGGNTFF